MARDQIFHASCFKFETLFDIVDYVILGHDQVDNINARVEFADYTEYGFCLEQHLVIIVAAVIGGVFYEYKVGLVREHVMLASEHSESRSRAADGGIYLAYHSVRVLLAEPLCCQRRI